jgi:hypothetical protein
MLHTDSTRGYVWIHTVLLISVILGVILTSGCDYVPSRDVHVLKLDAQGNEEWHRVIDSGEDDTASAVIETESGDYVIAGDFAHIGKYDPRLRLTTLDPRGEIKSQIDIEGYNDPSALIQTRDKGYAITTRLTGDVLRLDEQGHILWTIHPMGNIHSIIQEPTGDFMVAGTVWNRSLHDDAVIARISENGRVLWQNLYGGYGFFEAYSIIPFSKGDFLISGLGTLPLKGGNKIWILFINYDGSVKWERFLGDTMPNSYITLRETPDSGFEALAILVSDDTARIDGSALIKYSVNIPENTSAESHILSGNPLAIWTNAGGIAAIGSIRDNEFREYSLSYPSDPHILKFDTLGLLLWEKILKKDYVGNAKSMIQTSDNGFIIVGTTE